MNKNELIKRQIDNLMSLRLPELKDKFFELYGFAAGNTNAINLRRRIAYRLQEIYLGGISEENKAKLKTIADADPLANLCMDAVTGKNTIKGIRLSREWNGKTYEVITLGDGTFEYDDKIYKSLSAIAREITGTRWNGKIFFKVKQCRK